jgi:2-oxoglutarate ferredoxin oxidoreductase subunit beta
MNKKQEKKSQAPRFPKCYKAESKPHKFCPGCGHPIVLKMLGQVIDEMGLADKVIFLIDIGCSLLAWDYFDLPTSQTHHGRTVPTAVGFKKADPKKIVIAYVGDGGGYAIGLQHVVSSCLRNDPITTIVVNNTVYAMTGGQMAPTTTIGEVTTTTPKGKTAATASVLKGPEMLAKVVQPETFLARGTTDKPQVLKQHLRQALETQIKGHYSLVESLSACPLNWKTNAPETLKQLKAMEKEFKLGVINNE